MGAERHDGPRDGEHEDFDEHHTVADAYAPPPKARSRSFLVGVTALVALCVVVFLVARALG